MTTVPLNYSELFITRMRWLVILGSPLLFIVAHIKIGPLFWSIVLGMAAVNFYVHFFLLKESLKPFTFHLLSIMDIFFISYMVFTGESITTDLYQLYYFVILVLGIRYGVKRYFGLVFIIAVVYTLVDLSRVYFYKITLNPVELFTELIYFGAFGVLTSFTLQVVYRQQLEKEELIAELQSAYRQLCIYNAKAEELAITDPLTGLYNYRYFSDRLTEEMEWAKKYRKPLSIILLDIDLFKQFNDTYGHPAGDIALKQAAQIFEKNLRDRDVLARYGGEEFLILLPDTKTREAYLCAERIRQAIEHTVIELAEGEIAKSITISAGVATYDGKPITPKDLLESVDKALYAAKDKGRNNVKKYTEKPQR